MRFAIVLVILIAAHVAEAGGHCREVSEVAGYRACHRFAAWSRGAGMSWDLGASMLRFDPDPIEGQASPAVHATGVRFRNISSFGAWYFGGQFDFASISDGPVVVVARDTTMPSSTGGFVAEEKLAIGRRARTGALMFGGEIATGARTASFEPHIVQAWFVVDAQAKADVWLTPNFTLGATAGIDLVHEHDVSFAITLGAHLVPYDHTR